MFALYVLIIAASIIGLSITFSIYKKKHAKAVMVCPFGADCNTVINGGFSKFLGIGLEVYGTAYYAFIATIYGSFLLIPEAASNIYILFFVTGMTIAGFLFSIYLTFVQAFVIKTWCSWCLMSAALSTAIFLFTIVNVSIINISFIPLLEQFKTLILLGHLVGFTIGVGGATMADFLFFKFLKDFRISHFESAVLKASSQLIWIGLLIVIISGIGLYIPEAEALNQSSKFITKTIVVLVIIINGALLNLLISPKLVDISWKKTKSNVSEISSLRRSAFIMGSVSFISWYTALVLGFARNVNYSVLELLSMYVGAIIIGIVISQIVESKLCKKNSTPTHLNSHA